MWEGIKSEPLEFLSAWKKNKHRETCCDCKTNHSAPSWLAMAQTAVNVTKGRWLITDLRWQRLALCWIKKYAMKTYGRVEV
jgi:hypothetical protein